MTVRIKNTPAYLKAGPDDGLEDGQFLVYPSTFTREPDAYGDVVKAGAFADTIQHWKDSGNVLPGLYGHRLDDPDYFVASALDMGEDDHGWWVKGEFDLDSPKGAQVYRLTKGKRINQLSFAFDVADEGQVELEDGTKVNELRKLNVYEFSFVPVGANQDTSVVAVKALTEAIAGGGTVLSGSKAGRVLSSKNSEALKSARDLIDSVLESSDSGEPDDQEESGSKSQETASGQSTVNDEEPVGAKSQEPRSTPSAQILAAELELAGI